MSALSRETLLAHRRAERAFHESQHILSPTVLVRSVSSSNVSFPVYNIITGTEVMNASSVSLSSGSNKSRSKKVQGEPAGVSAGMVMRWEEKEEGKEKGEKKIMYKETRIEGQAEEKREGGLKVSSSHATLGMAVQQEKEVLRKNQSEQMLKTVQPSINTTFLNLDPFKISQNGLVSPTRLRQKEADAWSQIIAAQKRTEDERAAREAEVAAQKKAQVAIELQKQVDEHKKLQESFKDQKRKAYEEQLQEKIRFEAELKKQEEKRKSQQSHLLTTINADLCLKKSKEKQIEEFTAMQEHAILERIQHEQEHMNLLELKKKEALKNQFETLTKQNELSLKRKEEERALQKLRDVQLMNEYAQILEREEIKRKQAFDKVHERQNQIQQLASETHQSILSKQAEDELRARLYQEEHDAKQQKIMEEKAERANRMREATKAALSQQVEFKYSEQQRQKQLSQEELQKLLEQNRIAEEKDRQKQVEIRQNKFKYRDQLLTQAQITQQAREESLRLSEIERKLNAKYLNEGKKQNV